MARVPHLAVLFQGGFVVGGQLRGQIGIQGITVLGWAPWNRLGRHGAGFPPLPPIPFDGGPRDLEHGHDLFAWDTLIDRLQDSLAKVG